VLPRARKFLVCKIQRKEERGKRKEERGKRKEERGKILFFLVNKFQELFKI
jgi:hypothetical protein